MFLINIHQTDLQSKLFSQFMYNKIYYYIHYYMKPGLLNVNVNEIKLQSINVNKHTITIICYCIFVMINLRNYSNYQNGFYQTDDF